MLTFFLLAQTQSPDAVLKRFDQYMAKSKTLSVMVKTKVNSQSLGVATVRLDRPTRFFVSLTGPMGQESLTFTEKGVLEIGNSSKQYATHPYLGRIYAPSLKVTNGLRYAIPQLIVVGSVQNLFPPKMNAKLTPKVTVEGVETDQVSGKVEEMGATTEVRVNIDSAGRLIKYYNRSTGPMGTMLIEQDFSAYVTGQKFTDAQFSLKLPAGFSPFKLESADYGIPQGEALPNATFRQASSGKSASLKNLVAGKNTLVVITDAEFPSNAAMFKSIQKVSSKIPEFRLVTISMSRNAKSAGTMGASGAYYDPTGQELTKLFAPGAPTMYLVDKKGRVAQMFFGFDGRWTGLDQAIERLK